MYRYKFDEKDNATFPGDYESLLDEDDIMCVDLFEDDSVENEEDVF